MVRSLATEQRHRIERGEGTQIAMTEERRIGREEVCVPWSESKIVRVPICMRDSACCGSRRSDDMARRPMRAVGVRSVRMVASMVVE